MSFTPPTCWAMERGQLYNDTVHTSVPCGAKPGLYDAETGTQSCCLSIDECGANSLCRRRAADMGSRGGVHPSGDMFYIGGCTDPTFQSPICRNDCRRYDGNTNVVFVKDGIWACCGRTTDGKNSENCSIPLLDQAYDIGWSADEFPGPANKAYRPAATTSIAVSDIDASTSSSASRGQSSIQTAVPTMEGTSSQAPTATGSSSPTDSIPSSDSSGLSSGAIAGVAVGSVAALGLMVGIALFLRKRRARKPAVWPGKPAEGLWVDPRGGF